jgi:hypothetical protein
VVPVDHIRSDCQQRPLFESFRHAELPTRRSMHQRTARAGTVKSVTDR